MLAPTFVGALILIGEATQDKGGDDSVTKIVVAGIGAAGLIIAALIGVRAARAGRTDPPTPPPPPDLQPSPTLTEAAGARVQALGTQGPARAERLHRSRAALEELAAEMDERKQGEVRDLALQLARCTDRGEASKLRDDLVARAPRPAR